MKPQPAIPLLLIVISIAGILAINSLFVVDQAQQAVVTQFGEPVGEPILEPGLHWKLPFVQIVHYYDKRILEWDGYPSEIPTRDKKFIWVDVTGRWKISEPLTFLQTMQTEINAQSRLDDIMDGVTRNLITKHNLAEIVRSTNDLLSAESDSEDIVGEYDFEPIEVGREKITRAVLTSAREIVKEYGIELIDLRIKRINYIESVQEKVYERMISERKRAAEMLRSEGQGLSAEIRGKKEKELKRISSEAYRKIQKIQGEADAKATKIYGDAYSKDPDFFAFKNSLEQYDKTLKDSRLVLSTDNEFLKYIKSAE